MSSHNLNRIFHPGSIAVIGASRNASGVGRLVFDNLLEGGFDGPVYPVNPRSEHIARRKCFARIDQLPEPVDLAIICTPAHTVPQIVLECGERGIPGIVILSAGFRESGAQGRELEAAIAANAARFRGLRILGPNCLGFISPHLKLNASFAGRMPAPGGVTFLSQSGALCTAVLDWAAQEGIGFANFVSIGNMLDVSMGDLIDYFAEDPRTTSLVLYVESITQARQFMSAARGCSRCKPIVAYKAGRFTASAQAAASHTGAMAGVDAVYEAAFRRAGIVRLSDMDDMFDTAELLARRQIPRGPRLAIVTNAGGPGVMAVDALLERRGGTPAQLSKETLQHLDECLPPAWSRRNPVDVLGDAGPDRLGMALRHVLADPGVDAALVIATPQAMTHPTEAADAVIEAAHTAHKPVLASWIGGSAMHRAIATLNASGIPTYFTPEDAVRAFSYLVAYRQGQEFLYETPRDLGIELSRKIEVLREGFSPFVTRGLECLDEIASKALLQAYGIPVAEPHPAATPDHAVERAQTIGYPVVMKLDSPEITHKTDVRGVELNLTDDAAVRAAFDRITGSARALRPSAQINGVTIQRMISSPVGVELILGARRDPVFGPVLMLGAGGITAELLEDRSLELPPLNERLARGMIDRLRIAPLLHGYRGRPPIDLDQLVGVIIRISQLVADFPEIRELDVNPLLVTPEGAVALDARIILDLDLVRTPLKRFSHLAIHPYPDHLVASAQLSDGTLVTLRPIRPEDEPHWHRLLTACSPETIHRRFRGMVRQTTHEMAARYCFIDYDREMAIVAELQGENGPELIGVGRLVADADRQSAEYAVLVADAWQGRGLGTLLTTACLRIARDWGCGLVRAETSVDNMRVLNLFREHGFAFQHCNTPDVIIASKRLDFTTQV
jgi:acetyltransferase